MLRQEKSKKSKMQKIKEIKKVQKGAQESKKNKSKGLLCTTIKKSQLITTLVVFNVVYLFGYMY